MTETMNPRDEIRRVCETTLETMYTALGIDAPVNIFTDDMIDDALAATIEYARREGESCV